MKITVVGSGNVGATTAQRIVDRELADEVVLVDVIEGVPQGKGLDMAESAPVEGTDTRVVGSNGYGDTAGSDIVIITAGIARKPGMSRDDLQATNASIVKSVSEQVRSSSPDSIVIVVTNPLDVMTYAALKVTGFAPNRVFGMAGILDSARFRCFIAQALSVSVEDVTAFVLGGHGDSMVPLPRYSCVAGIPLPDLMSKDEIDRLVKRTRDGGAEIVGLLKTGSAYYAPSSSVAQMVESIVRNKKRILPCAAWLSGQYGLSDIYVGVPVKLGRDGVEEIIEIELLPDEREALHRSAADVRANVQKLVL